MPIGAGQIANEDDLTALVDASSAKPVGRVLASGTQSIPHNAYTAVNMATEEIDTHGFHSTSVNTSRVTPTVPGLYRFFGSVSMGGRADYTGFEVSLRPNGGAAVAPAYRDVPDKASGTLVAGSTALIECDGVTDYVEVVVRQSNTAVVAQVTAQSVQLTSALEWEYVRGPV